ncbi:NF038120 family PEP-CTERM protein [Duganella sp. PWIR1]
MKQLLRSTLAAAAALLFAGAANAYIIDFENVDASNVPFAPLLLGGDYVTQGGYFVDMQDINGPGGLIGSLSNGNDPDTCYNSVCPKDNKTNFLSVLNDGIAHLGHVSGAQVLFGGMSAAYIPVLDAPAGSTVYLAVEADRADGSYAAFYYPLKSSGAFMNIPTTGGVRLGGSGTLTDGIVTDLFVYGYFCDGGTGSCSRFSTNQGQFALDNILLTAVPEPQTYAMLLAGLCLMGVAARRKNAA